MIYDFVVENMEGNDVPLDVYKGKVLLVVNTATECGFTPHYEELQEIYTAFKDKEFEILDFPCNQFGNQAPGSEEEIHAFCTSRYGTTFPQFAKVDVKGDNAIPLYKWLESQAGFAGFGMSPMGMMMTQMLKKADKNFDKEPSVKWNFTKFLIDRQGNVIGRFEPTTPMKKVKERVEKAL